MMRIVLAPDLVWAQLVVDRLASAGLPARILNLHSGALAGEIPIFAACPEVWLDDDADEPKARALVAAMQAATGSDAVRRCSACGEDNPVGFEVCWSCAGAL